MAREEQSRGKLRGLLLVPQADLPQTGPYRQEGKEELSTTVEDV
jgi:hypothetical protein